MLIAVLLSWIPNLNRQKEPAKSIIQFSEFIFAPFRKLIPPIGMLDISPIFAFIVIGIVQQVLCRILVQVGL